MMHGSEQRPNLDARVYGLEIQQKNICQQVNQNREDIARQADRTTAANARSSQIAESLREMWALLGRSQDIPDRVFRLERWKESTMNVGIGICIAMVAVAFILGGEARKFAMAVLGL